MLFAKDTCGQTDLSIIYRYLAASLKEA